MSGLKFQVNGWLAVVAILALTGIAAIRFITLGDMQHDTELMGHVEGLLQNEYAPYVTDKVKSAVDTGNEARIGESVEAAVSTVVNISSVQASYPVLNFSTPKDVVVKVVYSFEDAAASGEERTIYYLFRKGSLGWQYQYITSSLNYYLNFI
jgi:hypothetical protein